MRIMQNTKPAPDAATPGSSNIPKTITTVDARQSNEKVERYEPVRQSTQVMSDQNNLTLTMKEMKEAIVIDGEQQQVNFSNSTVTQIIKDKGEEDGKMEEIQVRQSNLMDDRTYLEQRVDD